MVTVMKKTFRNIPFFGMAAALIAVAACEPEMQGIAPQSGQANFSKYIAIGNSLTAGYADNGLYLEGQKVAYPNLIAEQMEALGGGAFNSPFFTEAQRNGSGYIRLKALVNGQPQMEPVTDNLAVRGLNPVGNPLYTKYTDEISNYGVPGMRLDFAFFPGMGTVMGNPFFERILPENEPSATTYFGHVTNKSHTFFSFWLGNNDVLGYAVNGAYEEAPNSTTTLTDVGTFSTRYNQFIDELTKNEQKGVVATIPDVTAVPYFNTVTTALLEAAVTAASQGAATKVFITTASGVRAATNEDLFGLTVRDTLGKIVGGSPYGFSPANPLHSKFVLDKDEIAEISARVNAFNAIIKAVAERKELAVADAHAFLNRVKSSGIRHNGVNINASFVTGNAFSLDGIHLTPMGNALIANLFIDAINAKYGGKLTKVDVSRYRGVAFP